MGDNKGIKINQESDDDDNDTFALPLSQGGGSGSPKFIFKSPVIIKHNSGQNINKHGW